MTAMKREQSAELVDEERDEIQVIVENDRLERRFRFRKVVDLLHVVEDHHDHDDHRDSEEVGAQELAEDIPVEDLESGKRKCGSFRFIVVRVLQPAAEFGDHLLASRV